MLNPFFDALKIESVIFKLSVPESRITAMAPLPGGVDKAQMVSLFTIF
jgi:hypothetical protein